MLGLLLSVLGLGLASAASPVIFAVSLSLLTGKAYPIRKAFAFLLGGIFVALLLAFIGSTAGGGVLAPSGFSLHGNSRLDFLLGLLMLGFAGYELLPSKPKERVAKPGSHSGRLFLLGIVMNATNLDAVVLNLTAVREVAAANVSMLLELSLIAVAGLFFLSPGLLPLLTCILFPARFERILRPVGSFTEKYGNYLGAAVFIVFGGYLIMRAGVL